MGVATSVDRPSKNGSDSGEETAELVTEPALFRVMALGGE